MSNSKTIQSPAVRLKLPMIPHCYKRNDALHALNVQCNCHDTFLSNLFQNNYVIEICDHHQLYILIAVMISRQLARSWVHEAIRKGGIELQL